MNDKVVSISDYYSRRSEGDDNKTKEVPAEGAEVIYPGVNMADVEKILTYRKQCRNEI